MAPRKKKPDRYNTAPATPLVEIFNVSIDSDNDELLKDKCEIYGHIRVTDKLADNTFHIYNRDRDDPESVCFKETLFLTPPLDVGHAVIIPSEYVSVYVELYDRAHHDTLIAKGSITLNSTASEDWLEDHHTGVVPGENKLNAKVHYAIFPYAVPATVRVLFFSEDDHFDSVRPNMHFCDTLVVESCDEHDNTCYETDDCETIANLYGSVSAFVPVHGNDGTNPYRSSLLFRKPIEDFVEVVSGGFIELSRSVVAVPSYSSLSIKAAFTDRDTKLPIASGTVKFKPYDDYAYKKDIVGDNGARIRVQVAWSWSVAFDQLNRVSTPENLNPKTPEIDECVALERLGIGEGPLSPEHSSSVAALIASDTLSEDHLSETPSDNCTMSDDDDDCSETSSNNYIKKQLVEVFSVVVCCKDATPFKFHGSVIVADCYRYLVFHSRKSRPQDFPSLGLLAIVGDGGADRSFPMSGDLAILVDFKDVSGDIISKGYVSFRGIDIGQCGNKRMCCVVRGDRGFAAVHYSIFRDGVSASVTICLADKNLPSIVKGKIYARHVSCQSSRSYQENLFKSILFCDEHDGAYVYTRNVGMPLVKSIISVPRHSSLIVEADVSFSPDDNLGQDAEVVKGSVEIRVGDGPQSLCNDLYVHVEFFEAY